jgi:site-specific DNA-methyltransferase (adenine-specific)
MRQKLKLDWKMTLDKIEKYIKDGETMLTEKEKQYLNNERIIFNSYDERSYSFNSKKCIIEYKSNYKPNKELIRILRKKYNFPKGKYNVIYVDMPWDYNNKKTGGSHKSGATQIYNTIPTTILRFELSMLINDIAADNAVIFFWMTVPMEREQMTVFDVLDFKPKSKIFWHKNGRLGMGFWVRHQIEFMMIGTKGNVKAFKSAERNFVHLLETPVLKHSEKPGEFRKMIETLTKSIGKTKKIELFSRKSTKKWKSWGDQLGV